MGNLLSWCVSYGPGVSSDLKRASHLHKESVGSVWLTPKTKKRRETIIPPLCFCVERQKHNFCKESWLSALK